MRTRTSAQARSLAGGTAAVLLATLAFVQGGPSAAAQESPLPGVALPVPATDVTTSDGDLSNASREVVVLTAGADGPKVTKLRARSQADAERLAESLDEVPGLTAGLNRTITVLTESHTASPASVVHSSASTISAAGVPSLAGEEYGSRQWGLTAVGAESAWTLTRGAGITVAVVDSGVDALHSDLIGRVKPQIDVVAGPKGDPLGHGTHVAGIVAASLNGTGVAGLANQATVLPVRVLDANGSGDLSTLVRGIDVAVSQGVQVINLSLGGGAGTSVLAASIANATAHGITVVAAAGNSGDTTNSPSYPAVYPQAIAVGSVDEDLAHSAFSTSGSYLDLAAPGSNIWSTFPAGTWEQSSGTSMATPFVSATAALVRAANPTLSTAQVAQILFSTAQDDVRRDGKDAAFGYGLVRADRATATAATMAGGIRGAPKPVRVAARRGGYGNVMTVNVDPDLPDGGSYALRLQRRGANGAWVTLPARYATTGAAETRSLTLSPGVYRVLVAARPGYGEGMSAAARITAATVKASVTAAAGRSKLFVNIDPDKAARAWTFRVQKRKANGTWTTKQRKYGTQGVAETRTVNLTAGVYRVVVAPKFGFAGSVSSTVILIR